MNGFLCISKKDFPPTEEPANAGRPVFPTQRLVVFTLLLQLLAARLGEGFCREAPFLERVKKGRFLGDHDFSTRLFLAPTVRGGLLAQRARRRRWEESVCATIGLRAARHSLSRTAASTIGECDGLWLYQEPRIVELFEFYPQRAECFRWGRLGRAPGGTDLRIRGLAAKMVLAKSQAVAVIPG